jgi:hypothetical protein
MEQIVAVVLKELSSKDNVVIDVNDNSVKIANSTTSVTINNRTRESNGSYRRNEHRYTTTPRIFNKPSPINKQYPKVNSTDATLSSTESQLKSNSTISTESEKVVSTTLESTPISSNDKNQIKVVEKLLDVVKFNESEGLFREREHNFIVKQLCPGAIEVVGRYDDSKIVPLTSEEKVIAGEIGLII